MSQIETIMLVALGFAVAALIALFLGRIAWVFALGLGKKRMQRAAPTTIAELQSDRDRLRAEYAMLSRKLDKRNYVLFVQASLDYRVDLYRLKSKRFCGKQSLKHL